MIWRDTLEDIQMANKHMLNIINQGNVSKDVE